MLSKETSYEFKAAYIGTTNIEIVWSGLNFKIHLNPDTDNCECPPGAEYDNNKLECYHDYPVTMQSEVFEKEGECDKIKLSLTFEDVEKAHIANY